MLKLVKFASQEVYGYHEYCGFGDIWAVTGYLLRLSEESHRPSKFFTKNADLKQDIRSITPFFDSKGTIELVSAPPQRIFTYCEPYLCRPTPTIKTWKRNNSNIVACQFDGRHLYKHKNVEGSRLRFLTRSLASMGLRLIDVGNRKPISYIVDVLANCRFFVGCPSGLSVVSMSVGNPVYLITRMMDPRYLSFMERCHYKYGNVQMFMTVDEFLIQARRNLGVKLY